MEYLKFTILTLYNEVIRVPKSTYPPEDYPDLSGKVWIVTGGTGGLGLLVVKALLAQNAKVWIGARSQEKIDSVIGELRGIYPRAKINYFNVNFNDLTTIKPGVQRFLNAETRLDGVVHNIGVMNVGGVTAQGYDKQIGVNCVAPHLLQKFLDPLILATPGSRLVWLSSLAHCNSPWRGYGSIERIEKTHQKDLMKQYAMSKAVAYIQAVQWSTNHPGADTKSIAVHPGLIRTHILDHASWLFLLIAKFTYWDEEYGRFTVPYAAINPNVSNNAYVVPFGWEGRVRPDIYRSARGAPGSVLWKWLNSQVSKFE